MDGIVISCGGTGGHLAPGIALAEAVQARDSRTRITLLISQKKIDSRLSGKYPHLHFLAVPGLGFSWRPLRFFRCAVSQLKGLLFCLKLLLRERPAVVVGFGGFTSAGVTLAARLLGIPVALHEANRVPGLAVRTLGRLATRVYLPEGVRLPAVRAPRIRHVGLPVRREIVDHPRSAACERLGLNPKRRVLAVFGGSQGAGPLNDWAHEHLAALAAEGVQLYCVSGPGKGEAQVRELPLRAAKPAPEGMASDAPVGPPAESTAAAPNAAPAPAPTPARETPNAPSETIRAIFVPFCDDVATLLSAADLVVSRAGAGTIAELIRCGTPAILVPYPHAADDHQRANASFFERQGGGVVVEQGDFSRLKREVLDTIFNDWLLNQLRSNLRRMDRSHAADFILDDLERLSAESAAAKSAGSVSARFATPALTPPPRAGSAQ
ncbi:hypothetical protein AXK11_06230 [Cephaloticoccus primus]|uniref:UDP-N-acetylglucosamine--N-acetylmuramyl-(pentapeptide) pyrophosphoryl-undecaprenol N-acetylglucosamine transferase n=1 Tax=Cephaloticoccus primus TaxID=1548207 RepID=A0A139SLQ3_9BACT|nr:UDP-N-acetylglucosamine--N-acetylmuramyl-(pentapeptide) pyrophosphoryl-undecaprenol N-acetylglucosamine transferase [Cephaloticoccus primus]KXU35477.1 hypothetical protein AXK11_06230 [Cephaloticoccus primus]